MKVTFCCIAAGCPQQNLGCRVGVISEPQVFTTALTAKDAFIILASDGVWEFIDSQAAVDIVGNATSAEEGCRQASCL